MTSLIQGERVVRRVEDIALYGRVCFWGPSLDGRLLVVCQAPDGLMFISDPSHLEKVNGQHSSPKEGSDLNRSSS